MIAAADTHGNNTRNTLATILREFRAQGLPCDVFGGWAEELLGLRAPWPHGDIDLIHRGDSLAAFDALGRGFLPVPLKRFHHKRAFLFDGILCEIVLVEDADSHPVTRYWGDVPFHWLLPLLTPLTIEIDGQPVSVISAENLERHRRLHRQTQPDRWRDPSSLVP